MNVSHREAAKRGDGKQKHRDAASTDTTKPQKTM
jgi:hypothetical protein